MARTRKRRAADANEQGKGFAQIPRVLLESEAFKAIRCISAAKSLPVFIAKWGAATAHGEKAVCEFHYSEAEKVHGIPRKSFSRGLEELHSLGFIDCEEKGGVWQGNQWSATRFRRSERWRKFGTDGFVTIPWKTSEPTTKPKPPKRPSRGSTAKFVSSALLDNPHNDTQAMARYRGCVNLPPENETENAIPGVILTPQHSLCEPSQRHFDTAPDVNLTLDDNFLQPSPFGKGDEQENNYGKSTQPS